MNFKTLATASAALLILTGASFAQSSGGAAGANGANGANGSGTSGGNPSIEGTAGTTTAPFVSADEQAMYESNKAAMSGFFTDDTMTTLRSEEERTAAWAAMDEGQQAGLRSSCQTAMDAKEGYGESTSAICTNVLGR